MRKLRSEPKTVNGYAGFLANERSIQQITSWLLVPIPALAAYFVNQLMSWNLFAVLGLVIGLLAYASRWMADSTRDYLLSFCFVAHCILFTAALSGHEWQIDAHMLFFAALAITSTLANPRALLFATVLVALYHISFSIVFPKLVYPSGELLQNLERTVFHAAVVLLESGVLLISLTKRLAADTELKHQQSTARAQAEAAERAQAMATQSQQNAEHVVDVFGEHLSQMASGKLDCAINERFSEEYETLRENFNVATETLKGTIEQVALTTDSINKGATEISRASDDLSRRTESQAATLEEAAAALEELTASVESAAEGANRVENTMGEARSEAESSGDVVQDAMSAMTAIEKSSAEIAQIINVIDDIAFQTNLLALNAGVEAARAGEQGKGFAVVATEVRALAQRSAEAATEIKTLINESAGQVDHGVELVGKTGDAINKIVKRISHISTSISSIAEGAVEQASGLNEISAGVSQLDDVTQENAAMVSEATSAGQTLHADARKLSGLMAHFDIENGADESARQAAA